MYFLVVIFKRRCEIFYYFESGRRNSVPCSRINLDQSQGESFILSMVLVVIDIKDKISGMKNTTATWSKQERPRMLCKKHKALCSFDYTKVCSTDLWGSLRFFQGSTRSNDFNNNTKTLFASNTMLTFEMMVQKQWWFGTTVEI